MTTLTHRNLLALSLLSALLVSGCGGSSSSGGGGGGGGGGAGSVSIASGNVFTPQSLTAKAGTTVTWTNNDSMPHTVTTDTANGGPDSDTSFPNGLGSGASYSWTVPSVAPGTKFYYHCQFHGTAGNGSSLGGGMAGVVTVG